ncbi:PH domain leucine-rich repeat-containing protein phosphatase 2 isoform X1 [Tachysurus ichikawai]
MKDEEKSAERKSAVDVDEGRSAAGTWTSPGLHGAVSNQGGGGGGEGGGSAAVSAPAFAAGIRVLKKADIIIQAFSIRQNDSDDQFIVTSFCMDLQVL